METPMVSGNPFLVENCESSGSPFLEIGELSPATHILAGIDDDVEQDLAAIGIELRPDVEREIDDENRAAMAAVLLRRAGGVERELGSIQRTMDLELAAIRAHYERKMVPLRVRYRCFLGVVEDLARLIQWKRKKSAETPYGGFGVKDKSATVKLVDAAAATAWALTEKPDVIRIAITLSLDEAREYFTDEDITARGKVTLEWGKLKETLIADQTLPPGVEIVPGVREAFATPAELHI